MKLELKYIQHYPIGGDNPIKIIQLGDEPEILTVNGVIDVDGELVICANGNDFDYNSNMKLLLRPMTDLYKPLEDGSIPIVELAKIYTDYPFSVLQNENRCVTWLGESLLEFYYEDTSFYLKDTVHNKFHYISNQLALFEYLFKHHFDVYGLIEKGLAIDINTIQD